MVDNQAVANESNEITKLSPDKAAEHWQTAWISTIFKCHELAHWHGHHKDPWLQRPQTCKFIYLHKLNASTEWNDPASNSSTPSLVDQSTTSEKKLILFDSQARVPLYTDAWLLAQPSQVLVRRDGLGFLRRGDIPAMEGFESRLLGNLNVYNRDHADPYRWTYTGTPLVHGTPFNQTRREQRHDRSWFSPRPLPSENEVYAPRPY